MIANPRRRRVTGRRLPRAVATAVAAFVVAASALVASPASAAGDVDIAVVPTGSGIVRIGATASAVVTLTNRSAASQPAGTVAIAVGRQPITDRSVLDAWLRGDDVTVAVDETAPMEAAAIDGGTSTTIAVPLPIDDLRERAIGVYPIESRYRVDGGTEVARSVIVLTDGVNRGTVTVIAPITAPPTGRGLLTAADLATLTAPDGELTSQLDAALGTGAVVAVDPAILAAIRVLGTTAPPSAVEWLERLLASSNQRIALAFGDADAAAQVAAGLEAPLEPLPLTAFVTTEGLTAPTQTPAATPTPAAVGSDIPTLEQLTAVPNAVTDILWPAAATDELFAVAADRAVRTIVSSAQLTTDGGTPSEPLATIAGGEALVYDADLSATLERIAVSQSGIGRSEALVHASAQAALAVDDDGLLVVIDRDAMNAPAADVAVSALFSVPYLDAGGLDALGGAPRPATLQDAPDLSEVGRTLAGLLDADDEIDKLATVLEDPTLLTGRFRAEALQLAAVRWQSTPVSWAEAVAGRQAGVEATLDAVGIVPLTEVQVLGSSIGLPITVRNDLPYPITLRIIAQPDDLRLTVERITEVTAVAAANTSTRIPVTSRIGNGIVDVTFDLQGPTGVSIGSPQVVTLNVRAEWEAIGLIVIGVLVAGLFGVGIVRTVLRRRRPASTVDITASTEPEGTNG